MCVCVWVWFFGCFPRGCSCYRQTETHHLWVPSWTSSLSFRQGSTCGIPSRRRWRSTTTGSPEPVSRHRFPLLDYPHNDVNPASCTRKRALLGLSHFAGSQENGILLQNARGFGTLLFCHETDREKENPQEIHIHVSVSLMVSPEMKGARHGLWIRIPCWGFGIGRSVGGTFDMSTSIGVDGRHVP